MTRRTLPVLVALLVLLPQTHLLQLVVSHLLLLPLPTMASTLLLQPLQLVARHPLLLHLLLVASHLLSHPTVAVSSLPEPPALHLSLPQLRPLFQELPPRSSPSLPRQLLHRQLHPPSLLEPAPLPLLPLLPHLQLVVAQALALRTAQ